MQQEQVDSVMEVAAQIAGKSDRIEEILVLYRTKDGAATLDNKLTVGQANLLADQFKHWLMDCMADMGKEDTDG